MTGCRFEISPLRPTGSGRDDKLLMNYDVDDFTEDGILKPGIFLILVTIYSSRYLLYGPLSLIASRKGRGSSGAELDLSFLSVDSPFLMLVSIPAAIILFIMLSRSKESRPFFRMVWKYGKALLVMGAVGQLGLLILNVINGQPLGLPMFVGGFVNAYVLYYLLTSERVKDVFSMFPEKESNDTLGSE